MALNMGVLGAVTKKPSQFIATGLGSGYGSAVTSLDGPSYIQSYATTQKLNRTGRVVWSVQFSGTGNKQGLAIDSNQNVYVAGNGSFVAALDSSGNVLWQREIGTGISWNSAATDTAANTGRLYLAGTNGSYGHLACLNSSTGSVIWGKRTSTVNITFRSISANYSQVLATGYISNGTTLDSHVVKLDEAGNIGWQRRMSLGTSNFVFSESTACNVLSDSLVAGFINSPRASFIVGLSTQSGNSSFSLRANSTGGFISADYGNVGFDSSGHSYLSFLNLFDNYEPFSKGTGYTRFLGSTPQKTVTFENLSGTLRVATTPIDRTIGLMGTNGFIKVLGDDSALTGPVGSYTIREDPEGFNYISSGIGISTDGVSYTNSGVVSTVSSFSAVASGTTSTVTYLR